MDRVDAATRRRKTATENLCRIAERLLRRDILRIVANGERAAGGEIVGEERIDVEPIPLVIIIELSQHTRPELWRELMADPSQKQTAILLQLPVHEILAD